MTAEQRNLEFAARYELLYNTDIDRFVREVYAADCVVNCMGGPTIRGTDDFLKVEQTVFKAAPQRRMRVVHRHASGDAVVVEAVVTDCRARCRLGTAVRRRADRSRRQDPHRSQLRGLVALARVVGSPRKSSLHSLSPGGRGLG